MERKIWGLLIAAVLAVFVGVVWVFVNDGGGAYSPDEHEPNDSVEAATALPAERGIRSALWCPGDVDWFTFTLETRARVRTAVLPAVVSAELKGELLEPGTHRIRCYASSFVPAYPLRYRLSLEIKAEGEVALLGTVRAAEDLRAYARALRKGEAPTGLIPVSAGIRKIESLDGRPLERPRTLHPTPGRPTWLTEPELRYREAIRMTEGDDVPPKEAGLSAHMIFQERVGPRASSLYRRRFEREALDPFWKALYMQVALYEERLALADDLAKNKVSDFHSLWALMMLGKPEHVAAAKSLIRNAAVGTQRAWALLFEAAALNPQTQQAAMREGLSAAERFASPEDAPVFLRLSYNWNRLGDVEARERLLLRTLEADPLSYDAHDDLAEIYEAANRVDRAVTHLEILDGLFPNDYNELRLIKGYMRLKLLATCRAMLGDLMKRSAESKEQCEQLLRAIGG